MRFRALLPVLALVAGLTAALPAEAAPGDVWVILKPEANLSAAPKARSRTARGQLVVDALKDTAVRTQSDVRKYLKDEKLDSESFWVTNAILVKGATPAQVRKLTSMGGVRQVRPPKTYALAEPVRRAAATAAGGGVEWGVADINADDVWKEYGRRGEDIVIANIDTGVQFDHPALRASYRGANADGTVTHDYNWFDTSGHCAGGAPCDTHGHGTHTMGTMVGDDGQGNQIGVAPGVKWITANGCQTCSEEDLVAAAQWMLAPTDSHGQNPDVSKRPHIINNSWSSTEPTDEPIIEDILQAWAASGIMGVWANGNSGPSCRTSGSPGSRTLNYSVGAYGVNGAIASFSSRGPGQNGETKPNIAAPGVDVRSALPGGSYGLMSGTSMAAPHAAGAVALLWSAFPELVRDLDGTRALLDASAIDTADAQCGGPAEDNNVFGEGRLDASALLAVAKVGLGTLAGTVTDAETGQPVPGATVSVTGRRSRDAVTGQAGDYSLRLIGGDYQVKVKAFGYDDATAAATIAKDGTVTLDVRLAPTARVQVGGVVRDGSGQGWPLAAKVTASDGAGHTWTANSDAGTGAYRLELLPGTTYTLEAAAVPRGYTPAVRQVSIGTAPLTEDFALTVTLACEAPGYAPVLEGVTERLDAGLPGGWSVTNADPGFPGYAHEPGWVLNDPGGRTNRTGGKGGFAIVDSDHYGLHHVQETTLTSAAVDLSKAAAPALQFASDVEPRVNGTALVDVSLDGGRTWANVWKKAGYPGARGPELQVVELPQAIGRNAVRVRFTFLGQLSGWWGIDDVFLGHRTCEKK
ncbi:S8 family serine peptidase [Nonomuraea sp. NPDC049684]|uniref:S8 family serine peptidase n=1 Tax=Nonomuraea sp. NPDC049684 TaxID=3364356 RepID=UPI0037B1ADF9